MNNIFTVLHSLNTSSQIPFAEFLNKLKKVLNILNINEFKDVADGLRRYFNLAEDIVNDDLLTKVIGMLAVIFFYRNDIDKATILAKISQLKAVNLQDAENLKFLSIIEYFLNNLEGIVGISDKESDLHRRKLILMERVHKYIGDDEIRDKTVDLMLLMAE